MNSRTQNANYQTSVEIMYLSDRLIQSAHTITGRTSILIDQKEFARFFLLRVKYFFSNSIK